MKRYFALLILFLLMNVTSLLAQEATPEVTPEMTPEARQSISEVFASLPQSRLEDGGFVVGEPTAPITVIEFADYACSHCQSYRPIIDQVIEDFVATGQAKFELRLLPTAGGELTYFVGQIVECAEKQRDGVFWRAYDALYGYADSGKYNRNVGKTLATDFDLSYAKLLACAEDATQIDTDMALARQLGISGTPGIMVRYGDDEPRFIRFDGRTYFEGGVPYEVLADVITGVTDPQPEPGTGILVYDAAGAS